MSPGLMFKTDCEKLKFQSQLCLLMTCLSIIHHVFPMELFCYNTSSQHPSISRHSEMRTKHQQHLSRNHVQDNPLNTLFLLWKVFLNISLKKTSWRESERTKAGPFEKLNKSAKSCMWKLWRDNKLFLVLLPHCS